MNIKDFEIFQTNSYTSFINNGKQYFLNKEPYLDIILTDYCNASCQFCIADLIHLKLKTDFEKMKSKVLFALDNMNVKEVLLLGGEPTVSKNLIPSIKWLRSLDRLNKICMTSNGILLARDEAYREEVFGSGLTHCNISFMNMCSEKQANITSCAKPLTTEDIGKIYLTAEKFGVKVRVNCNSFKGSNDNASDVLEFYSIIKNYCHSIKFSPLLKVDAFSVVNTKRDWVNDHLLSDEEYDRLFQDIEKHFEAQGFSIIENDEQFGFVKNTMIPLTVPIILNYNQHGQMMKKVVEENKINNLKLLPNNELSLSWNRELTQYFITT